jgi:hypothetical protein
VSKLKTPQQKKKASLALDGRNVYGENDKASRKLIPRGKQTAHQLSRRAAKRPLLQPSSLIDEELADAAESAARSSIIESKRKGFKKTPDAPLGACLDAKSRGGVRRTKGPDGLYRQIFEPRRRNLDRS